MLVIRVGSHKILVRVANREDPDQTASSPNREDPDQTASSEAVLSGSALFVWAFWVGN